MGKNARQQTNASAKFHLCVAKVIGVYMKAMFGIGTSLQRGVLALAAIVGLRRDLYPDAPPYSPSPLPVHATL